LDGSKEILLREIGDFQVILLLMFLDPFVRLSLRIDKQRPSFAFCGNHTVVDTQNIVGQSLKDPFSDCQWGLKGVSE
jgi:hypothetical protein